MSEAGTTRVSVQWNGKTYEVAEIPASDDRHTNIALAGLELRCAFDKFDPTDLDPQPRLLLVARAFGEALNGGSRDQRFEDEVMKFFLANWGMKEFAKMMGAERNLVEEMDRLDEARRVRALAAERNARGNLDSAPEKG